jgi:pimeloyl-ACP methyl ester carboxylesterase
MPTTTRTTTAAAATQFLERPEGRIAYDVTGEGPLVLCLPGMGELRSVYRFTVPALVAAGFRVATMDLRGHGDSDVTFRSYDDVAAGEDALALIAHLGGPAVLLGSSMGAAAAVWAAAERPDAVAGLALIGPFVRDVPTNRLLAWAFRLGMSGPWARRVWTSYLPKLSPGRRPEDFEAHRAEVDAALRRPGHRTAFSATTRTSHAAAEARLAEVVTPTLVVMGERDPDFPDPAAEARLIAARLAGGVLLVPEGGHYPHAECPELVNPALVDFLRAATSA